MQSNNSTRGPDPMRRPALACGSLIGAALLLVIFGKHDPASSISPYKQVVQAVQLRFIDAADGSVIASDASSGLELRRIAPGEGGFVRVTMRSFAAERKLHGFDDDTPFTLERLTNGDLVLSDARTGRVMVLNAFGPSNVGAFASLIAEGADQ